MAGLDSMAQALVRKGACTLPRLRIRNLDLAYPIQQGGMGVGISWEGLAGAVAHEGCVGLVSAIGTGYHGSANPKMRLGRPDGSDSLNPAQGPGVDHPRGPGTLRRPRRRGREHPLRHRGL